jgi:DNA-binding CsgD family transcriptional regulator
MRRIERSEATRGLPLAAAQIAACRGLAAYQAGALADAEAELRAAIDLASELGGLMIKVEALARLMMTLTEMGRADQARLEVRASGFPEELIAFQPRLRVARGIANLALGDAAAAEEDFRAAGERLQAAAVDNPSLVSWRCPSAQALAVLGDKAQAARLVGKELELAKRFGAPRPIGIALRTAGQLAGGKRGIALLRQSLATLEHAPVALERARTRIELGAALRRANQRVEARELLRAGLEEAATCGAQPVVERAREELLATGARPRRIMQTGVDSLTASERRVARLAAEGLSNPEIAQQLFVTINTVEGHLRHIYQKLSINSRQQLPAALQPPSGELEQVRS